MDHRAHKITARTRVLAISQYGNMICNNAPAAPFWSSNLIWHCTARLTWKGGNKLTQQKEASHQCIIIIIIIMIQLYSVALGSKVQKKLS